jgi:mono/diheme cytochrome c family protein
MSNPRSFDRKRRLARMDPKIPRGQGRTLSPERRLRGLVDQEPDDISSGGGFLGDLGDKLGPKGRFLAAAAVIGALITGGSLAYERYSTTAVTGVGYTNPALVGLGHSLYDQNCGYCHGVDLGGQPGWEGSFPNGNRPAMPLDGRGPIARLPDRDLFDLIKYGGQPFSPPSYKNDMPAYDSRLADADIWAILSYIKSKWSEETLARQRELAEQSGS